MVSSSVAPTRTQRLGAYAVLLRTPDAAAGGEELLVTRISGRGFPMGFWALPGGGVDHGEDPEVAVVREIYEETGLDLLEPTIVDVHSYYAVAPGRDGVVEDYHGVHLLYRGRLAEPDRVPAVVEVHGTTDLAVWVPVTDLADGRPLLSALQHVLDRLAAYR